MSAKTVAAVVNVEDHSDELKEHPAGKFIVDYANTFDQGDHSAASTYHHPTKSTYIKSDGTTFTGLAAYPQIIKDYSVFTKVYHQPKTLVVYDSHEVPDGYEVLGTADVFADLVGERNEAEEPGKVKDRKGDEWDVLVPGSFHFYIEKIGGGDGGVGRDGMVIMKSVVYSDSAPVMVRLLKRGVLKLADVGL